MVNYKDSDFQRNFLCNKNLPTKNSLVNALIMCYGNYWELYYFVLLKD